MAKSLSTIIGTMCFLLLLLLTARYGTGSWLFQTFASLQIQGAALAFLLAAIAFGLHRGPVQALLALAALATGIHGAMMLGDYRQPALADRQAKPLFRLLNMNIMGDNYANGKAIADYIIASGADVVFIQESAPIGPQIDRIKAIYPYRLGCGAQTITCDQSLWSRQPFIYGQVETASPLYRDRLMLAGLDFGGGLVHFANAHFTKPYFDAAMISELKLVSDKIKDKQGDLILAGDFNASVLTPSVRRFLETTGLRTADSEPATWPVKAVQAGMAIDHVLVRGNLRIKTLQRLPQTFGSNHFGLMAEVVREDPTATYPPQ